MHHIHDLYCVQTRIVPWDNCRIYMRLLYYLAISKMKKSSSRVIFTAILLDLPAPECYTATAETLCPLHNTISPSTLLPLCSQHVAVTVKVSMI
jgi:hypothetical protein